MQDTLAARSGTLCCDVPLTYSHYAYAYRELYRLHVAIELFPNEENVSY